MRSDGLGLTIVIMQYGDPDKIRGTYNKATYLEGRREMMQRWVEHLDELQDMQTPASSAKSTANEASARAFSARRSADDAIQCDRLVEQLDKASLKRAANG